MSYPANFLQIWDLFPKRVGANPKKRAFKAYQARLKEGSTAEEMKSGAIKYLCFCVNTGKIGTEFIMMAATFFGPDSHYENEWELPESIGKTLSKDWTLPEEWKTWTEEKCPLVDPEGTADTFKDWALGNANRAIARKADWFATWKNWCRRDNEKYEEQAKWQKRK